MCGKWLLYTLYHIQIYRGAPVDTKSNKKKKKNTSEDTNSFFFFFLSLWIYSKSHTFTWISEAAKPFFMLELFAETS